MQIAFRVAAVDSQGKLYYLYAISNVRYLTYFVWLRLGSVAKRGYLLVLIRDHRDLWPPTMSGMPVLAKVLILVALKVA